MHTSSKCCGSPGSQAGPLSARPAAAQSLESLKLKEIKNGARCGHTRVPCGAPPHRQCA